MRFKREPEGRERVSVRTKVLREPVEQAQSTSFSFESAEHVLQGYIFICLSATFPTEGRSA